MSAEEHDAVFAAVSHLPHLLAYALVHEFAGRGNSAQLFGYAAGGFRDFTRIASSSPGDVARHLRRQPRAPARRARPLCREARARCAPLLERGDGAALERLFAEARAARERWLNGEVE